MNIFETIRKVTSGYEQYHSQFLADALAESLSGDHSLFDEVWKITAPSDWEIPDHADITAEELVERGQVDICVHCVAPKDRVIGIEVKTVDASAHSGQLEKYLDGLEKKYPQSEIQIAYLTPFNRERAGDASGRLRTIRVYEEFLEVFPSARHVSWLDIADIPWDANDLWRQHQDFVVERISAREKLRVTPESNRELAYFFGEEPVERFWEAMGILGVSEGENGAEVDLSERGRDLPSFARELARAFEILINSDKVSWNAVKPDEFSEELRQPFLNSPYREVHATLFGLSQLFPFVWVKGGKSYGVRVAHKEKRSSGVSLLTSYHQHPDLIVFGQRRRAT